MFPHTISQASVLSESPGGTYKMLSDYWTLTLSDWSWNPYLESSRFDVDDRGLVPRNVMGNQKALVNRLAGLRLLAPRVAGG